MAPDTRNQYFDVWNVYLPVGLGVFVAIAALVAFLVIRYRSRSRELPEGRDENQPLEVLYAVALSVVAAFLIFLTFSRMPGDPDPRAGGRPVEVEVTGARWNWRFEYPQHGIVEQGTKDHVPVLRVPVDTPIHLSGTSLDVVHSFWIPDERFKRDVFPELRTSWRMAFGEVASKPAGGECAEFCGLEHARMIFNVVVMPKRAFAEWAAAASEAAGGST